MKKLIFSLISTFLIIPSVNASFSDVAEDTKYQEAIGYLQEQGIINGYADGTFKPDNTLNRAELLKILIEAANPDVILDSIGDLKTNSEYQNCFPDVKDEWFAKYVCYAKEKGIINGYPDGTFKPGNTINKVEAVKIVIETFGFPMLESIDKKDEVIKVNNNDEENNFDPCEQLESISYADIDENQWYAKYLKTAKQKNITTQEDNFYPTENTTRGLMANYAYRSLAYSYDNFEFIESSSYSKNKYFVFYSSKLLKDADVNTFTVFKNNVTYAKDKDHAYYNGEVISNVDGQTFEIFEDNKNYFKDKDYVYYRNFYTHDIKIIAGADPETFEIYSKNNDYFNDKNHVYYYDSYFEGDNKIVEGADLESFEFYNGNPNLARDNNHTFFTGELQIDINPNAVIFFNNSTFKDNKAIYSITTINDRNNILSKRDYDPENFFPIDEEKVKIDPSFSGFFREGDNLINNENADLETFVDLGYGYAKDKNHLYHGFQTFEEFFVSFPSIDKESFETIDEYYIKDKNHVYYKVHRYFYDSGGYEAAGWIIETHEIADPKTFKNIGDRVYSDKNYIYYFNNVMFGYSDSFEISNDYRYAKYDGEMYYLNLESSDEAIVANSKSYLSNKTLIENLDQDSFVNICSRHAKDKNNIYKYGKIITLQNSKELKECYEVISRINMNTFDSTQYSCFGRDKNYFYDFDNMFLEIKPIIFE